MFITWLMSTLRKSWFLWCLIIINFFGSVYGFYWYKNQLASTQPEFFRIFVPDSPTGSALFTLFLITLLIGRSFPTLEAFAAVTNFKYGVWAVSVIIAGWALGNEQQLTDYMLMFSHAGMAIESLLYSKCYSIRFYHLFLVAIWTIWNDWLDYMLDLHPWLPSVLNPHVGIVGIYTFLLSLLSLYIIYALVKRNNKQV